MPRPEKVQAVEDIKERIEGSQAIFLTEFRGLKVADQQQLRRALRSASGQYKVVKMTLARRAASELGIEELHDLLSGPTAIAFAVEDPVPVAKALDDFAKEHPQLVIKGGMLGRTILPADQVEKLAKIEPREVLLAKIAGLFQAPLVNLAGMLQAMMRDTASVMSELLKKKEAGEFVPAGSAEATGSATDEAQSGEAPSDEAPTAETATDEAPSDEAPTAETATDETATDETPSDETPSGEDTSDDTAEKPAEEA